MDSDEKKSQTGYILRSTLRFADSFAYTSAAAGATIHLGQSPGRNINWTPDKPLGSHLVSAIAANRVECERVEGKLSPRNIVPFRRTFWLRVTVEVLYCLVSSGLLLLCLLMATTTRILLNSSIMASDSQSYDQPEYQSQPGRSTPPPTTSYTKPELPKPEDSTAIEPKEDKDEKKDEGEFSRPDANPDYKPENANQEGSKKSDFRGGSGDSKGDKDDKGKDGDKGEDKEGKKMNGGDVLDAQWVRPEELREEKEEENCAVNCIYYTMQCCECTIT